MSDIIPHMPQLYSSGCIINAMTPQGEADRQSLYNAIRAFNVGFVVVLEYERLENDLRKEFSDNPDISIKMLKRSGGVVPVEHMKEELRNTRFQEYFAGRLNQLDTFEIGLELLDFKVF